jgi:hypothetical protein
MNKFSGYAGDEILTVSTHKPYRGTVAKKSYEASYMGFSSLQLVIT